MYAGRVACGRDEHVNCWRREFLRRRRRNSNDNKKRRTDNKVDDFFTVLSESSSCSSHVLSAGRALGARYPRWPRCPGLVIPVVLSRFRAAKYCRESSTNLHSRYSRQFSPPTMKPVTTIRERNGDFIRSLVWGPHGTWRLLITITKEC